MIFFFSGQDGVRRHIPETTLDRASVMLSYYTAVVLNNNAPTGRMKAIMKSRRKAKKNRRKNK